MTTVSVLVPLTVTDAMLTSSTIAEPDSTYSSPAEVAWNAANTYAIGDVVVSTASGVHRFYECTRAVSPARSARPENDPQYWYKRGPSNRWAMFDGLSSTQSLATTSLTVVLAVGFFNALCFYGLLGDTLTVTVKDAPGGTTVFGPTSYNIQQVPFDEYDYCWGPINQLDRLVISGLVPYPTAELTVTVASGAGNAVGIGTLAFGDLASLVPSDATWAGPDVGAQAIPNSYGYPKVLDDGSVQIVKVRNATDLSLDLTVPKGGGDTALSILQRVLGVPSCWIGTDSPGLAGLNTFGLGKGRVTYDDGIEKVHIDVQGTA